MRAMKPDGSDAILSIPSTPSSAADVSGTGSSCSLSRSRARSASSACTSRLCVASPYASSLTERARRARDDGLMRG